VKYLPRLIISVVVCELVGIAATPFTISAIPSWYVHLTKPSFSPPNWVFGPVWTLLYLLMGISFYLIWKHGFKKTKVKTAAAFFGVQLGLNFAWSVFFFGLHSPLLGLIDIGALLIFIILTMKSFWPISKTAFYLLVPYLLWVSFATLLNTTILFLN
jgi:tryptophan-rich sensory protein